MGRLARKRCLLASDNGSQPYRKAFRFFEMAGMGLPLIISACHWVGDMSGSCPLPKGKVPGVWFGLSSHFEKPKGFSVWLATLVRCLWHPLLLGIANARLIAIELRIQHNGNLSRNIRILTPKNRGCWSRKGHSVEKTSFFDIFGNSLTDRRLHGYLSVI